MFEPAFLGQVRIARYSMGQEWDEEAQCEYIHQYKIIEHLKETLGNLNRWAKEFLQKKQYDASSRMADEALKVAKELQETQDFYWKNCQRYTTQVPSQSWASPSQPQASVATSSPTTAAGRVPVSTPAGIGPLPSSRNAPVATQSAGGSGQCPPGQFWDGRQCRGSIGQMPGGIPEGSTETPGGVSFPGLTMGYYKVMNLA